MAEFEGNMVPAEVCLFGEKLTGICLEEGRRCNLCPADPISVRSSRSACNGAALIVDHPSTVIAKLVEYPMSDMQDQGSLEHAFIRRTLIVLSIVSLFFLAWHLRSLLLLMFGAVLVAVIFRAIAEPVRRLTHLPESAALMIAVLAIVLTLTFAVWVFGSEISGQFRTLVDSLPAAWRSLERQLSDAGLGEAVRRLEDGLNSTNSGVLSQVSRFALSFGSAITDAIVVIAGGIYLAAQPNFYRRGIIKLIPPAKRALANHALEACGRALRLWLKGQLISMTVIGSAVTLGLWLLGVPSALALGVLAAILEFIPFVGPILAFLPALLIALQQGPQTALLVTGFYIVVQQLEGNLLQPLVQQFAVELPAAVLLFALLACGMIFGALGVLLGAPLAVVGYVAVKRLYVQEALQTPTKLPGEDD